jgi:hypothetical protein
VLYSVQFFRAGFERLLLLAFWAAQALCVLQGIAFGCATFATFAAAGTDASPWLRDTMASGLLISGIFFGAGLLLIAARRWRATHAASSESTSRWPLWLGLSLLVLAVVAALAASSLPALWNKIGAQLSAVGFWDALMRPEPSGAVMVPIFLALFVPLLLTAAAAFSVVFPLALVPLVVARSRLLPTLLLMGVICQIALVLTGWISADAFARLATQVLATMAASGDAEVLRVGNDLDWATGILTRTALALVAPTLGLLAWSVFLRPSGAAAAYFADMDLMPGQARDSGASSAPPLWVGTAPGAKRSAVAYGAAVDARAIGAVARVAQIGLVALGAAILIFGAAAGLRPQLSYVGSQPVPGATLTRGPAIVRVTLAARLDPGSSVSLIRLTGNSSIADGPRDVEIASHLATDDPERRTIEGVPARRLSTGLYRVGWWARPAGGGSAQYGSFSFGVDVPVPADTTGDIHSLSERDAGARRRRHSVLGGLLLIALGALLPRRAARV